MCPLFIHQFWGVSLIKRGLCQLVQSEYLCPLIKMLGTVFLSVNDMISEIRDLANPALMETERQRTKTLVQQVTLCYTITYCSQNEQCAHL